MAGNPGIPILLTRPLAQSQAYGAELQHRFGPRVRIEIAPLQDIRATSATLDLAGVTSLVFTSVNGVEAFAARSRRRDFTCLCVGDKTAATARVLGFKAVSADGNAEDLAGLIADIPRTGRVLHIRGEYATALPLNLPGLSEAVLYTQVQRDLTDAAKRLIAQNEAFIAPLFSPRSAALLVAQMLGQRADKATAICISPAVAAAVPGDSFGAVRVAARPRADAITQEIAAII